MLKRIRIDSWIVGIIAKMNICGGRKWGKGWQRVVGDILIVLYERIFDLNGNGIIYAILREQNMSGDGQSRDNVQWSRLSNSSFHTKT